MSRQILSSPFDWDVHQKVEEDGSSVAENIMVDTRVVRRRTFNASSIKNAEDMKLSTEQPSCISFDRRLMLGDIFANPPPPPSSEAGSIVRTRRFSFTGEDAKKQTMKGPAARGQRTISTPPPVKGRQHVSVQTYDTDTDVGACERAKSIESCAQTILRCSFHVDGEENLPPASSTSIEI